MVLVVARLYNLALDFNIFLSFSLLTICQRKLESPRPELVPQEDVLVMAVPYEVIESKRVPRTGPYSQAVKVGNLVFTAAQPGVDPSTRRPPGPTFESQVRQAFANLGAILEDAGSGLDKVVKVTCLVTDAGNFPMLNQLFEEFFPNSPPARTSPIVSLPNHLLFAIEAIAVCEGNSN